MIREKSGENIILTSQGEVSKNDVGWCRLQISMIFCISKYWKADKFAASIERSKARNVSASGGKAHLTP